MFILLLTILVVGLIITLAGLFLSSPKTTRVPTARRTVYTEQSLRVRRASANMNRQLRTRQFALDVEHHVWTNIFASINTGSIASILAGRRASQEVFWLLLAIVLLLLLAFEFYFSGLLHPGLMLVPFGPDAAATVTANRYSGSKNAPPPELFTGMVGASKALKRVGQLDPGQYNSPQQYDTWAYSTCSAAAMTEVINAYGHNYRITDILKVEAGLGEITPALGLMEPRGIDLTVARFGFTTWWLTKPSLDQVITVANHGHPVIVDFPSSRWAGGHVLVVIGGDNNYVYTADSSSLNMQAFTHQNFLKYWIDFAVVATPTDLGRDK
jgi:hypothetical protein